MTPTAGCRSVAWPHLQNTQPKAWAKNHPCQQVPSAPGEKICPRCAQARSDRKSRQQGRVFGAREHVPPPCLGLGRRRQQRGQQRGQGNLPSARQHLHLQGRHSEHLAAAPPTFGLSPTLCHLAEAARLPSPSRGPRGLTKGSVFTPDPLGTQAATSSPRLCCRSRCPQRLLFALPFRLHTRQQLQE